MLYVPIYSWKVCNVVIFKFYNQTRNKSSLNITVTKYEQNNHLVLKHSINTSF